MILDVLDPRGAVVQREDVHGRPLPIAPKVVGVLDNGKPNHTLLFEEIARELSERFPGLRSVARRKDRFGNQALESDLDFLAKEADLVLVGSAD